MKPKITASACIGGNAMGKIKKLNLKKQVFISCPITYGGIHCNKTSGVIDVCCMINTDICWNV
jgi:hypothetical protein